MDPKEVEDDPCLPRIVRFCRRYHKAQHDAYALKRLRADEPDLALAFAIYRNSDHTRWLLESLILAGVSRNEMVEYCPIPRPTLVHFENAFYDVRRFLGNRWFILSQLIIPMIDRCRSVGIEVLWKVVAFLRGARALEALLDPTTDATAELHLFLHQLFTDRVRKNALGAAFAAIPDESNIVQLQRLYLGQADQSGRNTDDDLSPTEEQLAGICAAIGLVNEDLIRAADGATGMVAEPRAAEQFAAAMRTYILEGPPDQS